MVRRGRHDGVDLLGVSDRRLALEEVAEAESAVKARYIACLALGLIFGCIADAVDERYRAAREWIALRRRLAP